MRATLFLLAAGLAALAVGQSSPVIKIHDGKHWTWYAPKEQYDKYKDDIERFYDYPDRAFEYLCSAWGINPPRDKYNLFVMPTTGGAFAAGDIGEVHQVTGVESPGIGVCYDAFPNVANGIKGYWAWALMTHEMVNVFTGAVVSGGWPVDWWADHVSPFPAMTAVQIEMALVPDVAVHHGRQFRNDKLYGMMAKLKDQFGWALFRTAFTTAKADGIHWDQLGPNPGSVLTNYVCAYLQLATPEDLGRFFREGGVPDFDEAQVNKVIAARNAWQSQPQDSAKRAKLHHEFLRGEAISSK